MKIHQKYIALTLKKEFSHIKKEKAKKELLYIPLLDIHKGSSDNI